MQTDNCQVISRNISFLKNSRSSNDADLIDNNNLNKFWVLRESIKFEIPIEKSLVQQLIVFIQFGEGAPNLHTLSLTMDDRTVVGLAVHFAPVAMKHF